MQPALIDQLKLSIKAADFIFSANGSSVKFPGFMALYTSTEEEAQRQKENKQDAIPDLPEGTPLDLKGLEPKQHFTSPPPRFSEASLVKELEENGIGRPSTYAAILSTIRDKGYVDLVNRYFRPTELGFIVNDLLIANFPEILDVEFTACGNFYKTRNVSTIDFCKPWYCLFHFFLFFTQLVHFFKCFYFFVKGIKFKL